MKYCILFRIILQIPVLFVLFAGFAFSASPVGTVSNPVVDSRMTWEEAVLRPDGPPVPEEIIKSLCLLTVRYRSFDGKVHQGQIVVHRQLADDVREVFRIALKEGFPVASVIPVSAFGWDDNRSMAVDNTSGFNYRNVAGTARLSKHALGCAVDINPLRNPYIHDGIVQPPGAQYLKARPGTLAPDSPLVKAFLRLGWTWGGHWKSLKDYQHFQKILSEQQFIP